MTLYIDINNENALPVAKPVKVALLATPTAVVGCAHWTNQELAQLAGYLIVTEFDPRIETALGGAIDNGDGSATPNKANRPMPELIQECQALLVSALENRLASVVTGAYGQHERETWRKQEEEARAYSNDNQAPTPYLDGIRLSSEAVDEQVASIMSKVASLELFTQAAVLRKRELLATLYACANQTDIQNWIENELSTGWPDAA